MATSLNIQPQHLERHGELLQFPASHHVDRIEHQIPSPEALVASFLDRHFEKKHQEVFAKREVISLLSGMFNSPDVAFEEIRREIEISRSQEQQVELSQYVGEVALAVVEA